MKSISLQLSLRVWLFLLTLLTVLPITWFAGSTLVELSHESRAATVAHLESKTSDVVFKIDALLQSSISALNALAQSDAAQRGDFPALYASAKRVLQTNPAFRAVTLIDGQGRMQFVTYAPYGAPAFPPSYNQLVQEAFQTGVPNVSGPFVTPLSDNKLVAVSVPISRHGSITHVLRMIILTQTVNQLLTQSGLPEGWLAAVADRDGILLARNVDAEKYVGKRGAESFVAATKRKERFMFQAVSLEGISITSVIVPIHNGDWFVSVAVPDELLNAPAREHLRRFLLFGTMGLLLSLAMSHWMARFLSQEMAAVTEVLVRSKPLTGEALALHVTDLARILNAYRLAKNDDTKIRHSLEDVSHRLDVAEDWFDKAPCGYHLMDGSGHLLNINQTELGWLGYSKPEVLGRHFSDFLTESSRQILDASFATLVRTSHVDDLELELVASDGSVRTVLGAANAVMDESGQVLEIRSALFDITERKQFEKALVEAHSQVNARRDFLEKAIHESR